MGNIIQDILGLVVRKKPVAPKDKDILVMARQKLKYQFNNIQDSPDLDDQLTTVKQLSDYIVAKVPNELPNPGTAGQVLALDSSLDPVWKDDADTTTTIFQQSDVPNSLNHKGDTYIVDSGSGFALTQGSVHYLNFFGTGSVNRFSVVSQLDNAIQMKGMIGIAYSTDASDGILLRGLIHLNYDVGGANGDQVYIAGSGQVSTTSPSGSGEYVRAVGYRIDNVSGNSIIFFDPSKDNIELN